MSPTPIDRRAALKGAAWATPVILHAIAAPATVTSPAPAPYAGAAFAIIGAGTGTPARATKIYDIGDGPLRGTGDLAPGARFGAIGGAVASQAASVLFTPTTALAPGAPAPTATTLFQRFGGMTITDAPTKVGTGYRYTVAVAATSSDPRAGYAHVASFTVRVAAAALGTYRITGANGRVGEFSVNAVVSGPTATKLVLQPTY